MDLVRIHTLLCLQVFTQFKSHWDWAARELSYTFSWQHNYHDKINKVYANSTVNVGLIDSHIQCLQMIDQASHTRDMLMPVIKFAVKVMKSETIGEAYAYSTELQTAYKNILDSFDGHSLKEVDDKVREKCYRLNEKGEQTKIERFRETDEFEKIKDLKDSALRAFVSLSELFNKLYKEVT